MGNHIPKRELNLDNFYIPIDVDAWGLLLYVSSLSKVLQLHLNTCYTSILKFLYMYLNIFVNNYFENQQK
jgi:hypothetical protein